MLHRDNAEQRADSPRPPLTTAFLVARSERYEVFNVKAKRDRVKSEWKLIQVTPAPQKGLIKNDRNKISTFFSLPSPALARSLFALCIKQSFADYIFARNCF